MFWEIMQHIKCKGVSGKQNYIYAKEFFFRSPSLDVLTESDLKSYYKDEKNVLKVLHLSWFRLRVNVIHNIFIKCSMYFLQIIFENVNCFEINLKLFFYIYESIDEAFMWISHAFMAKQIL